MMAAFLLQRPRILLLVVSVMVAAGLSAFWVLPRLEDPVLGRRVGIVGTVFPGADAEQVEALVTNPVEEYLQSVSGIRQVRSNSQTDISNVVIELDDEIVDVDDVWSQVRERLVEVGEVLPDSSQAPQLQVVPLKAFAAILRITPTASQQLAAARPAVRELKSALMRLPGTESVSVFGDPGEEVVVEVDPTRLAELGLPPTAIAQQIMGQKDGRPAGRIREPGGELSVQLRPDDRLEDRLAATRITFGDGESMPLSELGTIERRLVEPATVLALDGDRRSIALGVMVQDDQQIGDWDRRLRDCLAEFQNTHDGSLQASLLFSQAEHVQSRMADLLRNLGYGTLAVMVVVLVMMGWRSMLVVAAALPLSALLVLAAMRALHIPLHQMSVTGLIVALGLLIDNAIVMVDEVHRRLSEGESAPMAIKAAIRQLAMPLFGSTLTTVLAFLPIATLPGPAGEFVGTIAVSVILAIVASFLLAMTVIPALSGLLGVSRDRSGWLGRGLFFPTLQQLFAAVLRLVLRHPLIGVLSGVVIPACGFWMSTRLPEQFFPSSDRPQIQIELELATRDSLERAEQAARSVATVVQAESQVRQQHWFVGGSAPTFFYNVVPRRRGTPFYAQAFVDLQSTDDLTGLVRRLQQRIDQAVPECRALVRLLEQGPPFDAPVEVRLLGPDIDTLRQLGRQVRGLLQETRYVIHTRADLGETVPGLTLQLDGTALQAVRMDEQKTAGLMYTLLEGAQAGTGFERGEELPVRVRLNLDGPLKLNRVTALPLPQPPQQPVSAAVPGSGSLVPDATAQPLNAVSLARVASVRLDARSGAIVHVNGRRACEVKAYAQAGVLPSVVLQDFQRRLAAANLSLPDGYELTFGGEKEQRSQAVNQLIANGVVLFSIMLLTLVASFQSFRCAAIVAAVGGLAIGLGPLALYACGFPFGFMAIVGTMGLVGVAINDSIVVLAALRAYRRDAESRGAESRDSEVDVILEAARHVLATTLTTIVGFLPLIVAGGRFWPPLAVTIAGGVGGATLLALIFVPALHVLLFGRSPTVTAATPSPSR